MSTVTHPPALPGNLGRLWKRIGSIRPRTWLNLAIAVAVGLGVGLQISNPNQRVLKATVGLVVLMMARRLPIYFSLTAFVILFPFPFPTAYGSSNMMIAFLIMSIWLAKSVTRETEPARRTPLDLPIISLMAAYLLSFGNIPNYPHALHEGLVLFSTIVATVFIYYLITFSVRDEKSLRRLVNVVGITAIMAFSVGIYELLFPGRPLVQGWILSRAMTHDATRIVEGVRVGGPFGDFELFGEFCALMSPLTLFRAARAETAGRRAFWGGLVFVNVFVLMATVTRGAIVTYVVGMIYLLFLMRKTLGPRRILLIFLAGIVAVSAIDYFLENYTVSGSVLERLMGTKIQGGLPDSRTFWPRIIKRCMEHIWVGHGPYYEFGAVGREKLTAYFWPHNGYLYYLHTVGLLGLSAYLWILARLWLLTRRHAAASLSQGSYAGSLALVWHVALTMFIVDQTKIEYLRNETYQFFPWILFGLIVVTADVLQRQAPAPATPDTARSDAPSRPWVRWRARRPGGVEAATRVNASRGGY